MIQTAVEAPGEAPSRATIEESAECDDLGAELQRAGAGLVLLDDLHPLAGDIELPVGFLHVGIEVAQRLEAMARALEDLADQVFLEREVVPPTASSGSRLSGRSRHRQVEQRAVLQELGREAGIGAEQHPALALDDAGVEMGHRHRRRAGGRHAVDLGGVAIGDLGLAAAQPDAAHREAGEALGLGDAGFLQQRQRGAAGAQEDVTRADPARLAGRLVR